MDDRFRELLKTRDYIIFDGAMGTMLQAAGMKMGETPEVLNITRPDLLVSIAEQYYNAGSDVVYANTFGANRYKLEECGKSVEELVTAGIVNAKKARDAVKPDGLVALDVGPIGQLLEPTGVLSFEEAYDMYAEIVKAGAAAGADLVVFETMTDLLDVKAAVLAAKENSDLPIVATMTFEQNMRTFTGCSISAMALTLTGLGVDALGLRGLCEDSFHAFRPVEASCGRTFARHTTGRLTSGEQSGSCDEAAQGNLFPRFHSAMYFFSLILRSSVLDSLSSIPSAFRQNSSAFSVSPVM